MSAARALAAALLCALAGAAPASAAFGPLPGPAGFDVSGAEPNGSPASEAASHPYTLTAAVNLNLAGPHSDGDLKSLRLGLPAGLILNPTAVPRCSAAAFHTPRTSPFQASLSGESCPEQSQLGVLALRSAAGITRHFGLFNLAPAPGAPARIGASPFGAPLELALQVREANGRYALALRATNVSQQLEIGGLGLTLWGNPWLVGHDRERGNCLNEEDPSAHFGTDAVLEQEPAPPPPVAPVPPYSPGTCSIGNPKTFPPEALLTLPGTCEAAPVFSLALESWQQPGVLVGRELAHHDAGGAPLALGGCEKPALPAAISVPFATERTSSATGLDFNLAIDQQGLLINTTPGGRLRPDIRAPSALARATVALPEGMSVNPSVGSGLGYCTAAQYEAESASSAAGAGCPNAAKIGTVSVATPLAEAAIAGSLFLAQPDDPRTTAPGAENPFDSLLALYLLLEDPGRGVLVKVAGRVSADPRSGQLVASFADLPQLPFSHLNVHLRDGQRSPLATPVSCGRYPIAAELVPWSSPAGAQGERSEFELTKGIGGAPCPQGTPPFAPRSVGGTLNRNAGSYAPFYLHLTREDPEQEITSYSASFPKGLLGNISKIPYCPEAAIERAARNRGFAEAERPSCPEASSIGHTVSGYGLGSVLAYAPGGLYLAGPYHGSAFSIVAIDSATVGPFDLGVIIVRSAIRVDRRTAQVSIDSEGSDPIPHIIDGIPIHLRDVRVYLDRPRLTLNPTSCEVFSVASVLTGSGPSFATAADDSSAGAANPFQVSNCSALGFEPKLALKLKGGTRRGRFPALKATVTPRAGDANIGGAQVTLPPSLFLEQSHIDRICTRVQFAADACPAGSLYGWARATTPLLGAPLQGPVYLRASENPLPDLVAALKGQVEIDVVGRIDSHRGGIRSTFEVLPDAPVTRFELTLKGGRRGVLANSENLCQGPQRALARFWSQSNATFVSKPKLALRCKKEKKGKGKR